MRQAQEQRHEFGDDLFHNTYLLSYPGDFLTGLSILPYI